MKKTRNKITRNKITRNKKIRKKTRNKITRNKKTRKKTLKKTRNKRIIGGERPLDALKQDYINARNTLDLYEEYKYKKKKYTKDPTKNQDLKSQYKDAKKKYEAEVTGLKVDGSQHVFLKSDYKRKRDEYRKLKKEIEDRGNCESGKIQCEDGSCAISYEECPEIESSIRTMDDRLSDMTDKIRPIGEEEMAKLMEMEIKHKGFKLKDIHPIPPRPYEIDPRKRRKRLKYTQKSMVQQSRRGLNPYGPETSILPSVTMKWSDIDLNSSPKGIKKQFR